MYGRYPETLQTLKLEDLLFTGVKINLDESNEPEYISPVDPFLFNICYYLFCSDKEAEVFEKTFDPSWCEIYLEGYNDNSMPFYCRIFTKAIKIIFTHYISSFQI